MEFPELVHVEVKVKVLGEIVLRSVSREMAWDMLMSKSYDAGRTPTLAPSAIPSPSVKCGGTSEKPMWTSMMWGAVTSSFILMFVGSHLYVSG